jgi:hypothetical protein
VQPIAEQRATRRPTFDSNATGGWVVRVADDGDVHWVAYRSAAAPPPVAPEEQALAAANGRKIAELRNSRRHNVTAARHRVVVRCACDAAETVGIVAAGVVLGAFGVPYLVWDAAASVAVSSVRLVYRMRHRAHAAHGSQTPSGAPAPQARTQTHPGFVVSTLIEAARSVKQASEIEDTALEDELDAFYPHRSRTDFELGLRRQGRFPRTRAPVKNR